MQKYSGFDYFQNKHGSKFLIIKKFTTLKRVFTSKFTIRSILSCRPPKTLLEFGRRLS